MQQTLNDLLSSVSAANLVDIGLMTTLIYFVLTWFRGTRAFQIMATLMGIGLFYILASRMGLILTSVLFQYLWAAIIVVLAIVFQPEIREMLDRASPIRYLSGRAPSVVEPDSIDEIVTALGEMARQRLGALIVFQRLDRLDNLVLGGKHLDCEVSADSLVMVFQKGSPLHDGAVILRRGRIKEAGCVLPISRSEELDTHYGTRHRAALGLCERCDSVCVVVSEERGEVSLVMAREITTYKKKAEFREALDTALKAIPGRKELPRPNLMGVLRANWPLKIFSFCTALLLWFVVVGPHLSEVGISVPIQYTGLPSGVEIAGKWMDRIDVRLRGSEGTLASIKPGSVRAVVDLSQVVPGLNYFRISSSNLLVPPGTKIVQVRPSDLNLTIEAATFKKVAVTPSLLGTLPENAKLVVTPAEVKLLGVTDQLKSVTSVTTEPVKVPDLIAKGKLSVAVLVKPEKLRIDSVDPAHVTVTVETEPK